MDAVLIVFGAEMKGGGKLARLVSVPVINGVVREDCTFDAKVSPDASAVEIVTTFKRYCRDHALASHEAAAFVELARGTCGGWPAEVQELAPTAAHLHGPDGLKRLRESAGVKSLSRTDYLQRTTAIAKLFRQVQIDRDAQSEF